MVRVSWCQGERNIYKRVGKDAQMCFKNRRILSKLVLFSFNLVGDMSGTQNILHVYVCLLTLYKGAFPLGPFNSKTALKHIWQDSMG